MTPKPTPASGDDKPQEKVTPRTTAPSGAGAARPRGPGAIGWSLVVVFILLAIFYGWRTESNRAQLTDRNLRELDRVGRTVESRIGSYGDIVRTLAIMDTSGALRTRPMTRTVWAAAGPRPTRPGAAAAVPAAADTVPGQGLFPGLVGRPGTCHDSVGIGVAAGLVRACFALPRTGAAPAAGSAEAPRGKGAPPPADTVGAFFSADALHEALDTLLFDVSFMADPASRILLLNARGGGVRMQTIPRDTSEKKPLAPASSVRSVSVGGHGYLMFLQPLAVRVTPAAAGSAPATATWWAGGLVSTSRFRAESLALEPPHIVFLGLLILLALLSLPYLRVALMGPAESVRVSDVHLLSLALMLGGGVLGVVIGDVYFSGTYRAALDRNLVAAGDRLAGAFHAEIGGALSELDYWRPVFDTARDGGRPSPRDRTGILDSLAAKITRSDSAQRASLLHGRYLPFQMIVWVSPDGVQKAKWTPRAKNTSRVPVRDRAYFRRIVEGGGYSFREGPGSPPVRYAVESISSMNTGENLAAVSTPYCWRAGAGAAPAPGVHADPAAGCDSLGVEVLITQLLSLDRPILPPGVRFAVVDPTGATLFHSDPERVLAENFVEETDRDAFLRAALAAQGEDTLDVTYMGRRSRLYVRPLEGTTLSLVVLLDDAFGGTARFESVFTSMLIFFAFALLLWLVVVGVEHVLPGQLRWAWPVPDQPRKYMWLTGLMVAFGAVLLTEAVGAATLRIPVHPGAFMVPLQALAVVLLVQSTGIGKGWGRPRWWANPSGIGWTLLAFVTGVQVGSHLTTSGPGWFDTVIGALQFAVAAGAAWVVLRLPRLEEGHGSLARWYVAAGTCAAIVLAVLPAYLLHQEAFAAGEARLVRYEQARLLGLLEQRAHRVWVRTRQNKLPDLVAGRLLAEGLDTALTPVFGARWTAADGGCATPRSEIQEQVFSRVRLLVPFVTDAAVEMRNVGDSIGGAAWERCDSGLVRLRGGTATLRSGLAVGWRDIRLPSLLLLGLLMAGGLVTLYALIRWTARRVFLLDLPAFTPIYLREQRAGAAANGDPAADRLLVICTPAFRPSALPRESANYYLDLRDVPHEAGALAAALNPAPADYIMVLDHGDTGLDEPTWRAALLGKLEELVYQRERKLVLMLEHEPGALFPANGHAEAAADDVDERWTRLLGQFVKISAAGIEPPAERPNGAGSASPGGPGTEPPWLVELNERISRGLRPLGRVLERRLERLARLLRMPSGIGDAPQPEMRAPAGPSATLADECPTEHGRLAEIRHELERRYAVDALTEDGVLDLVREAADPYYRALWSGLEKEEKLVVAQLARKVVVNPESRRPVRRLLARGVLVRNPELRLMNQSFARFVREEVPPEMVRAWEKELPDSPWQRLRFPLILALGVVAAFLFATQRETFDMVLAIVTGVGLASTAVFRLVGGLTGGKSGN